MNIKELEDKLIDLDGMLHLQDKKIKTIENKEINMPDFTVELKAIQDELKSNSQEMLDQLLEKLNHIEKLFKTPQQQVTRHYRILLFPETGQGQYYKIVFGRLFPWGIFFVIASYLFILAKNGIEAWGDVRYNDQSEHCVRAWLYMNNHASRQVKKSMDQAWVNSFDSKGK